MNDVHKKITYKQIMAENRREHCVCIMLLMLYSLLNIIYPYLLQQIIDVGIAEKSKTVIVKYSIIILTTIILNIVIGYFMKIKFVVLGQKLSKKIKKSIFDNFNSQSLDKYMTYKTGDLVSILENDVKNVEVLFTYLTSDFLTNCISFIGIGGILFSLNMKIASIVIIATVFFAYIQKKLGSKVKEDGRNVSIDKGKLQAFEQEYLSNYFDIKALNGNKFFDNKFYQHQQKLFDVEIKMAKTKIYANLSGYLFQNICLILAFIYGGWQVMLGYMTIGSLFSLTVYIQKLYSPILAIFKSYMDIKRTQASINRINELLANGDEINSEKNKLLIPIYSEIKLKNVSFKYAPNNNVLNKINLTFNKGDHVALIGANGTGKTTLIHLLLKDLTNYTGSILIDGIEIRDLDSCEYKKHILCMSQNVNIYSGTIYENVTLFNYKIPNDQVEMALKNVGLFDEIDTKHLNLNTVLGADGITLSGGQAQKLNIARVLINDPEIIILDEPTAALDIEAEKKISKMLFEKLMDKLVIVVTHRKEMLAYCNKIVDMNQS